MLVKTVWTTARPPHAWITVKSQHLFYASANYPTFLNFHQLPTFSPFFLQWHEIALRAAFPWNFMPVSFAGTSSSFLSQPLCPFVPVGLPSSGCTPGCSGGFSGVSSPGPPRQPSQDRLFLGELRLCWIQVSLPGLPSFLSFAALPISLAHFQLQVCTFVQCHVVLALREKTEAQRPALLCVNWSAALQGLWSTRLEEGTQLAVSSDAPPRLLLKQFVSWRVGSKVHTSCNYSQLVHWGSWSLNVPFGPAVT